MKKVHVNRVFCASSFVSTDALMSSPRWLATILSVATILSISACRGPSPADAPLRLTGAEPQESATDVLFISVHAVSESVAWASGTLGTFARTTDGGATWSNGRVAGADSLQFRDVHGIDEDSAYLLSIGNGTDSRIYRTDDGGATWRLQFQNELADAFFDCFDFWDADHGIAFSDAVGTEFVLITTDDGGGSWTRINPALLPPALPGEGSFAASGTCLTTHGTSDAWIGTGAGGKARVLHTPDRGASWSIVETPIVGGTAAGIASVAFRDALNGIAVGGDLAAATEFKPNVATTNDGGKTWSISSGGVAGPNPGAVSSEISDGIPGMIYGVSWVPGAPTPTAVAASPAGVNYSVDNGMTWTEVDTLNYWGVDFFSVDAGWTVGTDGKITRRYFRSEDG